MRLLSAGKGEVVSLGFAPGRSVLVAVSEKSGTHVWDLATAERPVVFGKYEYQRQRPLAFSPDGRYLFRHGPAGRVAVDLANGTTAPAEPVADSPLSDFAQTPDGERIVFLHTPYYTPRLVGWRRAADGRWVDDWSAEPGDGLMAGHALSPAGDWFVHFHRNRLAHWPNIYQLVVRSATTGVAQAARGEHPYSYRSRLFFRPDGAQVVGLHDMTLLVWPVPDPRRLRLVRNDNRKHFTAVAYHPSSRYLLTTSNDTTVIVWDVETWRHVTRYTWDIGRLKSVAVSPDGTLAAAGSDKGQIVVWDVDV
jgi:WD40 repeat protein